MIKILFYPHQYRQVSHTTSKSNYVKLRKWTSLRRRYSYSGLKLKVSPPPHQHVAVSCLNIVYSYLHIHPWSASDDIVSFSFQWYCWYFFGLRTLFTQGLRSQILIVIKSNVMNEICTKHIKNYWNEQYLTNQSICWQIEVNKVSLIL